MVKGQFLDPPREPNYWKTPKQLKDLEKWYAIGVASKKDKINPEGAHERMAKRQCVTTGRRFYSFRVDFCEGCAGVDWSAPPPDLAAVSAQRCALANTPCSKHPNGVHEGCKVCNRPNGIVLPVDKIRAYFAKPESKASKSAAAAQHNQELAEQMAAGEGVFAPVVGAQRGRGRPRGGRGRGRGRGNA